MKQVVQNLRTGETQLIDVPKPIVQDNMILIKTKASLVSSGTERTLVNFAEKNLIGKAQSRPDLLKQVVEKAKRDGILTTLQSAGNRLDQPLPLGYSSAGVIEEIGRYVNDFQPGDRVVCGGGGYAVHAEYALIPINLVAHLPEEIDYECGAFATLGAIAINGIRLAKPQIGEHTAVIGLGLLGLLTAQLLKAAGCEVTGMDIDSDRIELANRIEICAVQNKEILRKYKEITKGVGFDSVYICADTPSNEPIALAGSIARDRAHVIAIGAVGLEIPRKPYYEKELFFQVARSYGPGRYDPSYEEFGNDYPIGYIRWAEGRNLEAFVGLLKDGRIQTSKLITNRFGIHDAKQAYDLITDKSGKDYLGVILTYPKTGEDPIRRKVELRDFKANPISREILNVGVIGSGNYANAIFLPIIKRNPHANIFGIISAKGLNASQSGTKYGAVFAGSQEDQIFENEDIDAIAILTRHNEHARMIKKGLLAGKHIYCEKPMALNYKEHHMIQTELENQNHPMLMVGFNRRFAPFSKRFHAFFENRKEPIYLYYRVNAGFLPKTHWLNNPDIGGGRLIGEGCHFIDLATYFVQSEARSVTTAKLPNQGKYSNDNLQVSITFADGSIATIAYLSNGTKSYSKEYIEGFSSGNIAILNDFRELRLVGRTEKKYRSRFHQDKGHAAAWGAFVDAIMKNKPNPIPYNDLIMTSALTLASQKSLHSGKTIPMASVTSTD